MEKKPPRKKYPPTEGWKRYNEKLVKRGEFYLDLEFVKHWNKELARMNRNKPGRPYEFPQTFVQFAAMLYMFFSLPYRQTEGVLRKLSVFIPELKSADYSTLGRRISDLKMMLPVIRTEKPLVVAIDSSGMKVTNRGEWMREKHGVKRRGWIKVHIAVDVETKELVALEVTDEGTSDSEMFKPLIDEVDNVKDVLADGAYDSKENFEHLTKKGLGPPGIKIRENASRKGLSDRAFAVREFIELGYEKWKRKHCYGKRWSSEGFFSAVKRIFGEGVRATSVKGAIREVRMKFMFYSMLLNLEL